MTKTKQINFRISPEELLRFKTIALSYGMDASEYFREKFLDTESDLTVSRSLSTAELQKRAKAAEKIIALREIEKTQDPINLRRIYYGNLINLRMEEIANYAASRVELDQDASSKNDNILKMLEALQHLIHGEF
jgi:antitoxin component of RelBE/YafQ-DinJ toxin-antitoxin module